MLTFIYAGDKYFYGFSNRKLSCQKELMHKIN